MPHRTSAAESLPQEPQEPTTPRPEPVRVSRTRIVGAPSPEQRAAAEARAVESALGSVLANLEATQAKLGRSADAVKQGELQVAAESWTRKAKQLVEKLPPASQEAYAPRIPGFEPAHLRAARVAEAKKLGAMHEEMLAAHEKEEIQAREEAKRAETRLRLGKAHARMMASPAARLEKEYMESTDAEASAQAERVEETEKELAEGPWFESRTRVRARRKRIRELPEKPTAAEVIRGEGHKFREMERGPRAQKEKALDLRRAFEARVTEAYKQHPDLVPFTMRALQDAKERLERLQTERAAADKKLGFLGRIGRSFARGFGAPPEESEVEIRALARKLAYGDRVRDALSESYEKTLTKEELKKLRKLRAEFSEE